MTTAHLPAPPRSAGLASILLGHNGYRKSVGATLQDYRVRAGMTQSVLADRASVARSTVEKLETDWRRATPGIIWQLCEVLGVSIPARKRLVERAADDTFRRTAPDDSNRVPTRRDLSILDTPHPAALLLPGAFVIVGTNASFTAAHRGLEVGHSYVEWLLFDTRAREMLPGHEWRRQTHSVLRECRELVMESVPDKGIREIEAHLSTAPDFHHMWTQPAGETLADRERMRIRHPDGDIRDMYSNMLRATGTPWSVHTLVPA